jgi:ssDNA-binding Zn-finger/Zn-ribbon topoisomerase 1
MSIIIGTPYTKGAGYLMNGKNLNASKRTEADIRTCTHCQKVIQLQAWKDAGAWCGKCMAPICDECGVRAQTFGCEPFIQKIEQFAEGQMRFQKLLKEAGMAAPVPQTPIYTGAT